MQSGLAPPASSFQPTLSPDLLHSDPSKKQKKKRSCDDAKADAPQPGAPKEKKRKRKHQDDSSGNTPVVTSPEQDATVAADSSKQERKRKKKEKGKSKDTPVTPTQPLCVPEPQMSIGDMDDEAQASAAALLSAIVAAATGASSDMMGAPPPQQLDSQYPPPMMSNAHPHYIPMGPEQHHPYTLPPHMQLIPDPSAFSNMGLPFSDLSFGSNEDVLRALQDLDITKIANVLKTLGDAAAAANVPPLEQFPPPPMFYPNNPPPQPPTPIVPAPSNAILGIPPKKLTRTRMIPPPSIVPEQHGNPDHATLLATKWLGAAKLAELVRTEGMLRPLSVLTLYADRSSRARLQEGKVFCDRGTMLNRVNKPIQAREFIL